MTVFVDTTKCERVSAEDMQGEYAEIVNKALCDADNVVGMLRWLEGGQHFDIAAKADTYQLVYVMEGDGVITLNDKNYDVGSGAGIYLEPSEFASIAQAGDGTTKLFHLVVPKLDS